MRRESGCAGRGGSGAHIHQVADTGAFWALTSGLEKAFREEAVDVQFKHDARQGAVFIFSLQRHLITQHPYDALCMDA